MQIKQIALGIKKIPVKLVFNSDAQALMALRSELQRSMPKSEVNEWVKFMIKLCKNLNIRPGELPINKKYAGNLSLKTNMLITQKIIEHVTH